MFKDETDKAKEPKSFREKIAHARRARRPAPLPPKMDPLGFALDNYNAVGRLARQPRTASRSTPSAVLPTGEKFDGAGELKQVILKRQGRIRPVT